MKPALLVYLFKIYIYILVAAISSLTFCKSFEILQKFKVEIYGNFVHNIIMHITHFDTISNSRVPERSIRLPACDVFCLSPLFIHSPCLAQVFCWMDKWHGLTMDDIRALEDQTKLELDEERAKVRVTTFSSQQLALYVVKYWAFDTNLFSGRAERNCSFRRVE